MVDIADPRLPSAIRVSLARQAESVEFDSSSDKGANGYLFFGRCRLTDRRVALKFHDWSEGEDTVPEPKHLAELDSRHVIQVLGAEIVGDGWASFQTPFMERGDLDAWISEGHHSYKRAMGFTFDVLGGLSTLHEARLVHRDLKPANIFLGEEGAVIGDFGSVRRLPEGSDDVTASRHAVLYRPPESFDSSRYGFSGDIYQVGMVLYQLLGGELSYDGASYMNREECSAFHHAPDDFERQRIENGAIKRRAQAGALLQGSTLPPWVSGSVRKTVSRACNPRPDKRFPSCAAFMDKLRRAMTSQLDWCYLEGKLCAHRDDRRIELRHQDESALVIAHQDLGSGFRRIPGWAPLRPQEAAKRLEGMFG